MWNNTDIFDLQPIDTDWDVDSNYKRLVLLEKHPFKYNINLDAESASTDTLGDLLKNPRSVECLFLDGLFTTGLKYGIYLI